MVLISIGFREAWHKHLSIKYCRMSIEYLQYLVMTPEELLGSYKTRVFLTQPLVRFSFTCMLYIFGSVSEKMKSGYIYKKL